MPPLSARTNSKTQVQQIIQKLNSSPKIKKEFCEILRCARASLCDSPDQTQIAFTDALRGLGSVRVQDNLTFSVSSKLRTEIKSLISHCIKTIGVQFGHENDIERAIWESIALYTRNADSQPIEFYSSFRMSLIDPSSPTRSVLLPNHSLSLAEEVDELTIGPVKALSVNKSIEYLSQHNISKSWDINAGTQISAPNVDSNGKIHFGLPGHCWLVEVASAKSNATSEAIWLIDIAISLLNLTMSHLLGPRVAILGQCDTHPLRMDPNDFSAVLEEKLITYGFSESTGHYTVGRKAVEFSKISEFCKTVDEIFFPAENSIAQRLARGLGWLSRARRRLDKAERFLLFFTAIESVLSEAGNDAPIVQNIARFSGAIMTDNHNNRYKWARDIKTLYGLRSKLVHHGVRGISMTNVKKIEEIAELLFLQIIDKIELHQNYAEFVEDLKRASYGLPWMDGREGWLERARA